MCMVDWLVSDIKVAPIIKIMACFSGHFKQIHNATRKTSWTDCNEFTLQIHRERSAMERISNNVFGIHEQTDKSPNRRTDNRVFTFTLFMDTIGNTVNRQSGLVRKSLNVLVKFMVLVKLINQNIRFSGQNAIITKHAPIITIEHQCGINNRHCSMHTNRIQQFSSFSFTHRNMRVPIQSITH
ncbi:hypothetical protein EK13BL_06020 [Bifidobacterium longum subsp. longum EK13]|nr:hypothetical protein EK13BL_06020 [Bifidobacterium longum subsp. longum EK13]